VRKVILQIDVTLDGFIGSANGELGWVSADEQMARDASDLLASADTILLGRVAYQMLASYWPFADSSGSNIESKIAHQLNTATKLVFSKSLERVEWGKWNNARLVHENIAEEITKIKALPGKNLVLYGGAEIVSTFTRLGLIDEFRLRFHPLILGTGKPLFQNTETLLNLKLIQSTVYKNGAVLLDYEPAKT
jgi:dihydrofolate reductase